MIQQNPIMQSDDVISKWRFPIGISYTSMWTNPLPSVNTNIENT